MAHSLSAWLDRLERLHPTAIEMGLERVAAVCDRLGIKPRFPVILVGGTNGKGSTCAILDAIYRNAGYDVGLYTSPHLRSYNERVCVNGREAQDDVLVSAFERIDAARGDISLTYFEFGTLAAQLVFCDSAVEVAILEVGLGGRLDAVNIFEPACSLVVSVAIDHVDYLGDTREAIGQEKAGIFRRARPAICADNDPPASLLEYARSIGAPLHLSGRDFGYTRAGSDWQFWNASGRKSGLPFPGLRGTSQLGNAAAALECVYALRERLPVDMGALRAGLVDTHLPGRFQVLPGVPQVILDVAHNAAAAQVLAADLRSLPCSGRTLAVFAVLADKQIPEIVSALGPLVDAWFVCDLPVARGAKAQRIRDAVEQSVNAIAVRVFPDVTTALAAAGEVARGNDRILVFGSFYTVGEAMKSVSMKCAARR